LVDVEQVGVVVVMTSSSCATVMGCWMAVMMVMMAILSVSSTLSRGHGLALDNEWSANHLQRLSNQGDSVTGVQV